MTGRPPILVTGGAGFIGSHVCKQLSAAGYLPIAFDNLSRGHREAVRWGPLVQGDIRDAVDLRSAFAGHRPVAILHLAALAYVSESVADPSAYYSNNVAGTLALLDAAREWGVGQMIFSSSCATYGEPDAVPISEASPQRPVSPYGRTKRIGEQILEDYAGAYGLRSVILRYFNACGCDPEGEIGEWHTPETHLVPRLLMAADGTIPSVDIFGDDYDTPDGTCIRDYVHVSDLARAHRLALDYLMRGGESFAANIGSGRGISVRELLAAVSRRAGRAVPIRIMPRRPGDPAMLYADPSLARQKIGFATELSDIETILDTAAAGLAARPTQQGARVTRPPLSAVPSAARNPGPAPSIWKSAAWGGD